MFGLSTFGELIFADMGSPVYLDRDWDKLPSHDCDDSGWIKIDARYAEAEKIEKGESEWTVIK